MTITELLSQELEREVGPTRRVLEQVPEGKDGWKPHEKSMPLGYLAQLVALLPSWVTMVVKQDELDLAPPDGKKPPPPDTSTNKGLLRAFDQAVAGARDTLKGAKDDHLLNTRWQLKYGGKVVYEATRYVVLRDSVLNHLAHHRGQLTVYLRLNGAKVPSIYGPTADEGRF